MNLFTVFQSISLIAALVTAAPSFQNRVELHPELYKTMGNLKSPYMAIRQNYSDEQADEALQGFVGRAMFNYSTWLAQEDPLKPDPTEVTLVAEGFDFVDMNAVMKIR